MSNEDPTPDEFDAMLDEVEIELPQKQMTPEAIDSLVLQPDIAEALAAGVPVKAVAEALGIKPSDIKKRLKTAPMGALLKMESRRMIRHMMSRNLKDEKYADIMNSLSKAIEKYRLIDNEPTEIVGNISKTTIERISVALFGQAGRDGGQAHRRALAPNAGSDAITLPKDDGPRVLGSGESDKLGDSED